MPPRCPIVGAALVMFVMCASPVLAQCDDPATDAERAACLGQELHAADARVDQAYRDKMAGLGERERDELRRAQRGWRQYRDASCGLASSQGDRDERLESLLADYRQTVCVVRVTTRRVSELEAFRPRGPRVTAPVLLPGAPPVASRQPVAAAPTPRVEDDQYELSADHPRARDKWYFEVRFNRVDVARLAETALFVGVSRPDEGGSAGPAPQNVGTLVTIRQGEQDVETHTLGVGVDLDNGKVYLGIDGRWERGAPGTTGGLDVELGRDYVGAVTSTVSLRSLLDAGALSVNFGGAPFTYAIPDGYRPFETP